MLFSKYIQFAVHVSSDNTRMMSKHVNDVEIKKKRKILRFTKTLLCYRKGQQTNVFQNHAPAASLFVLTEPFFVFVFLFCRVLVAVAGWCC